MAATRKTGMRKSMKQQKKQQQRRQQQKKQQRKSMKKGGLRRRRNTMRGGATYKVTNGEEQKKLEIALDEKLADGSQIVIVTPREGGKFDAVVVGKEQAATGELGADGGEQPPNMM